MKFWTYVLIVFCSIIYALALVTVVAIGMWMMP